MVPYASSRRSPAPGPSQCWASTRASSSSTCGRCAASGGSASARRSSARAVSGAVADAGRRAQGVDDVGLARGMGGQQVQRHRFGRRLETGDRRGGSGVQLGSEGRRDVLVDRRADEGVDEAQRFPRFQHSDVGERVGERSGPGRCELGEQRGGDERRLLAEHRDGPGEGRRVRIQPADAHQHRGADAARGQSAHAVGIERVRRVGLEPQLGEQLGQQERVAAADVVTGMAQLVIRGRIPRRPDQDRHRGLTEWPGPEHGRAGRQDERPQQGPVELGGGPGGHGDQDGEPREPVGEVVEEAQRRLVGPVGVVDGQQHGLAFGQVRRQPVQAVQPGEVGFRRARFGTRAEQRRRQLRGPGQHLIAVGVPRAEQDRAEQLANDAEPVVALQFATLCGEHAHAGVAGAPAQLAQQQALADAGDALDRHHVAFAVPDLADRLGQLVEIGGAVKDQPPTAAPAKLVGRPRG